MSTEAKVGAFVVVCAVILCAAVYRIGNAQRLRGARVSYHTYLRYAGGLEPDADVLVEVLRRVASNPHAAIAKLGADISGLSAEAGRA